MGSEQPDTQEATHGWSSTRPNVRRRRAAKSLARLWEIADCGSVPHDAHARALGGTSRAHWLDGISKMDGKF